MISHIHPTPRLRGMFIMNSSENKKSGSYTIFILGEYFSVLIFASFVVIVSRLLLFGMRIKIPNSKILG